MKKVCLPLVAALLSIALPTQAERVPTSPTSQSTFPNATTDPFIPIYRISGVYDNGGAANVGVATAVHCTNLSSVTETLKFIVRQWDGSVLSTQTFNVVATRTFTTVTHPVLLYGWDAALFPMGAQAIDQGNLTLSSTTTNMYCSAMTIDAAATTPNGISLHMLRFNPMVGAEGE